jgi:hypothetical protein
MGIPRNSALFVWSTWSVESTAVMNTDIERTGLRCGVPGNVPHAQTKRKKEERDGEKRRRSRGKNDAYR